MCFNPKCDYDISNEDLYSGFFCPECGMWNELEEEGESP